MIQSATKFWSTGRGAQNMRSISSLQRDILLHLPVMTGGARLGGFAAAAASLNMSASAVSHAVRAVEDRLGEPLFARTTRSVSLTEAGRRFLAGVGHRPWKTSKRPLRHAPCGAGRSPAAAGQRLPRLAVLMALTPILASLAQTHPRGVVEVHTNDAFVDIVAEGFDVGVRLGEAVQQDMVAVRIMPPSKPFSWPHRAALPLAARPCLWQS